MEGESVVDGSRPAPERYVLPAVLLLLFATGWAANHFTAMLPVLARSEGLSHATLDGAFGIYAVGLLPGLLGGGSLSDRLGRRPLLLWGAAIAGLGNLALLGWHDHIGIFVGRLIVGIGVGVAMSAGTAWSADIGGGSGSVLAGVALSVGFGCGPIVSGLLGQFAESATFVPFAVTVALSAASVLVGVVFARTPAPTKRCEAVSAETGDDGRSVTAALRTALPMALWVFSCATVAMVTMAERMQYRFDGPWIPSVAAGVTLTAGITIQMAARRGDWGPWSGVTGALTAAAGFGVVAIAGATPSLAVFLLVAGMLGVAYGLCLRQGLIDIETLTPTRLRGALTGVFYAITYLGFGLPVLLVAIRPWTGITAPMLVLTALAVVSAIIRGSQIRRQSPTRAQGEPVPVSGS
jgi:MFS family permease